MTIERRIYHNELFDNYSYFKAHEQHNRANYTDFKNLKKWGGGGKILSCNWIQRKKYLFSVDKKEQI